MKQYHKIQSIFKREMDKSKPNYSKFIEGLWSLPEFEYLKDNIWRWDEKIDGTNIRVIWNGLDEIIEFKGKTDKAEIPKHLLEKLQQIFIKEKLKRIFGKDDNNSFPIICLYGEGYGHKIQSGGKYFNGKEEVGFILFDIKIGDWWLKREDIEKIADQLGIRIVPIRGYGTLQEAIEMIKARVILSQLGKKDFLVEGLVLRPKIELKDRRGHRIITKIKHRDF